MAAAIDKSNLSSDDPVFMLVDVYVVNRVTGEQTGEIIRLANTPQEISTESDTTGGLVFQGNTYQPAAFDVQLKETAGEVPTINMTVKDVTGIVRNYMDLYAGGVGFNVRVSVVWGSTLDLPSSQQRAEIQEMFQVISGSIADRDVTWSLGAPSLLAFDFPRRRQTKDFCQWQYKGVECAYTGGMTTCDRTLKGENGCEAHDNVANFGGFPGIQPRGTVR